MKRLFLALLVAGSLIPAAYAQEELKPAPSIVETKSVPTVYHSGWAVLDAAGNLTGKVVTVGSAGGVAQPGAAITLRANSGKIVTGQADENGQFTIPGVEPGVYELTAASEAAFASHGIHVIAHKEGASEGLSVFAAAVSPKVANEILRTLAVPQAALAQPPFGPLTAPPLPIAQSHQVSMSNGIVNGRLAFTMGFGDPRAHTVQLMQNGKLIDSANVDSMGYFTVKPAGPGAYDVIVGGVGRGAVGVEIVDTTVQLSAAESNVQLVAKKAASLIQETLMVPVAMPAAGQLPGDGELVEEFPGALPMGGGFPGGGGFGGGSGGGFGGGGGGLGGAGGLLGVAGLAVGVAALSDDDDGFNGNIGTQVVPVP
jgi:uncharacterized membrane protein YgcG